MTNKTLKELFEVYRPAPKDEQEFVDKHVTIKHKDRNGNGDDVFKGNTKTIKRKGERHGYDAGDDEKVYEEVEELEEAPIKLTPGWGDGGKSMKSSYGKIAKGKEEKPMGKLAKFKKSAMKETVELPEEVVLEEGHKVGYKNYTITAGPAMKGMGEGRPEHIDGSTKKLANLGIEHKQGEDYCTTRRVSVKNNETGEETHHHVYQSDWGKDRTKPCVSVRHLGKPKAAQDAHHNVLKHYLAGKLTIHEDVEELDEDAQIAAMLEEALEILNSVDESTLTEEELALRDELTELSNQAVEEIESLDDDVIEEGKLVDPAKMSGGKLMDHITSDDVQKHADGTHTFRRGFFYRHGKTSDDHAASTSKDLTRLGIKHTVVDHGTQDYKPFRGGASVRSQNHHWTKVRIHPGQKIDLDESVQMDEAVRVTKHTHDWGKMITVHDGAHQSFPLHPEHQAKIRALSKGDKTSFKDETGKTIHAERTGTLVHLKQQGENRTASVGYHHFQEEVEEIDEMSPEKITAYKGAAENDRTKQFGNERKYNNRLKGVSTAVKKLTKEDIINRAIENYLPEEFVALSLDEQLLDKIEHLPESCAVTLLELFNSLNEENQITMINTVETQEGINSLLDFAINSKGA